MPCLVGGGGHRREVGVGAEAYGVFGTQPQRLEHRVAVRVDCNQLSSLRQAKSRHQ